MQDWVRISRVHVQLDSQEIFAKYVSVLLFMHALIFRINFIVILYYMQNKNIAPNTNTM